ncbi:hypothetical protein [Oxalicibacterium faecigallinarum]|uniref:Uncharacterized protein n=1 Tax=Oxalicibacterium faecigallinarum TaxID=573741 RepID=A0A8J3F711_9BURK|nr:hypothetical protein [Oxalicibacterium faecigallinarum]GGI20324.1 hypothetical protein GCM10008066_23460 [Oxalicibacterium faecigallinarum]
MRLLAILIAVGLLTACNNDNAQPFALQSGIANKSQLTEAESTQAWETLMGACQNLAKMKSDLSDWTLVATSLSRTERDYGWSRAFEISFRIADQPDGNLLSRAAGHVCTFTVGGGDQPGYFAVKNDCARICGASGGALVPVPDMVFLDDPQSHGYRARRDADAQDFARRIKAAKPPAFGNDHQAQRQLAYLYSNESYDKEDRIRGCAWGMYIVGLSSFAGSSDRSNLDYECGSLTAHERDAASREAESIAARVSK